MSEEIKWPDHKGSLSITHNEHLNVYGTIEQFVEDGSYMLDAFIDEAELAKCIETGSVWEIRWYPETPVGFRHVIASTFERAYAAANTPTTTPTKGS